MIKYGQSIHPNWINGDLNRLDEELREIKAAGADSCELVLHGLDVVIGGRVVNSRLESLLMALCKHELFYTLHMPYDLNLLEEGMLEIYLSIFNAGIEFAYSAGISLIVYHAGKSRTYDRHAISNEVEQLKRLAMKAPDILFCMENPLFFSNDEYSAGKNAESMIDFCEKVNLPNFKLAFDIGHSFIGHCGNKYALLDDISKLLPYIGHIHLHDNYGIQIEMREYDYIHRIVSGAADIHLPLGWGSVPIKEALSLLKGYDGIINMEIEHRFNYQYSEGFSLIREYLS